MEERMKKYVFIGAYDKTDMLIYVAKILTLMEKKVILVDTTVLKKSRYVVPTMVNEKQYITSYENIDVAIGFDSFQAIQQYQRENFGTETEYDIVLFDIDRAIAYQRFGITNNDMHFFVTSFDIYCLKRGLQILAYIAKDVKVEKVYFSREMLLEEDEYLNYLAKDYTIKWNKKDIIFFPFSTEDMDAIYTNQRAKRIQIKGLSSVYIDSLLYLVEKITGEGNGKVRKAFKKIEN